MWDNVQKRISLKNWSIWVIHLISDGQCSIFLNTQVEYIALFCFFSVLRFLECSRSSRGRVYNPLCFVIDNTVTIHEFLFGSHSTLSYLQAFCLHGKAYCCMDHQVWGSLQPFQFFVHSIFVLQMNHWLTRSCVLMYC